MGTDPPKGNGNPPYVQLSWEDDSDQELKQDNRQSVTNHSIGVKPLLQEEDEWDEVSVLELLEEPRQPVLGGCAGARFPVPLPGKAGLEPQESEPCPQALLCALSPPVPAQALRGYKASLAFEEHMLERRTESPSPPAQPCSAPLFLPSKLAEREIHLLSVSLGKTFKSPDAKAEP